MVISDLTSHHARPILFAAISVLATWYFGARPAQAASQARVIGGKDVVSDVPWMAGLHYYNTDTGELALRPYCGGSLIASQWVLTAAHCVDGAVTAENLRIRIDSPYLGDAENPPVELQYLPQYSVDNVILHDDFKAPLEGSDIALLHLETPSSVLPASLARSDLMSALEGLEAINGAVNVLGWGVYDDENYNPYNAYYGSRPNTLQEAILDYLPIDAYANPGDFPANVVAAWLVEPGAEAPYGADTCFGDSGGPLFVAANRGVGDWASSQDQLVGVTSYGNADCDSSEQPGVYTRVNDYLGWIESVTGSCPDALVDLKVAVNNPAHDVPTATTVDSFAVKVKNLSALNQVDDFSLIIKGAAGTVLTPGGADGLTCAQGNGSNELICNSQGSLASMQGVAHSFSVTDIDGGDRSTDITASLTSISQEDYQRANNSSQFQLNFTDNADLAVKMHHFDSTDGTFDLSISNLSDGLKAYDAYVVITVSPPPQWLSKDNCAVEGLYRLVCFWAEIAPLQTISLPVTLSGMNFFGTSYSISVDSSLQPSDQNYSNNSDDQPVFHVDPLANFQGHSSVSFSQGGVRNGGFGDYLFISAMLCFFRRKRQQKPHSGQASLFQIPSPI